MQQQQANSISKLENGYYTSESVWGSQYEYVRVDLTGTGAKLMDPTEAFKVAEKIMDGSHAPSNDDAITMVALGLSMGMALKDLNVLFDFSVSTRELSAVYLPKDTIRADMDEAMKQKTANMLLGQLMAFYLSQQSLAVILKKNNVDTSFMSDGAMPFAAMFVFSPDFLPKVDAPADSVLRMALEKAVSPKKLPTDKTIARGGGVNTTFVVIAIVIAAFLWYVFTKKPKSRVASFGRFRMY